MICVYVLLLKNDLVKKNELVARVVDIPVLWLSRTIALYVMNYIDKLALESTEKHTVT